MRNSDRSRVHQCNGLGKYLDKETVDGLFAKKYHFRQKLMIGKDGQKFHCLEELNTIPLIEETRMGIKVNFDIPTFMPLSVKFLLDVVKTKKKKLCSDERNAQMVASGDSAQLDSTGSDAVVALQSVPKWFGQNHDRCLCRRVWEPAVDDHPSKEFKISSTSFRCENFFCGGD